MQKKSKKILAALLCGVALTGEAGLVSQGLVSSISVKAATTSVSARSYGVDVASYQSSNLSSMAAQGGQFAIVKVSEGTSYQNPKAANQIQSALANNMMPMAYHFATFGSNSSKAVSEANYAISSAKAIGLPSGSYIACDWEAGQGNAINNGKNPSANAIVAFMNTIKQAGFQPLLYSGAYLLKNNINTSTILAQYPNSLWVASYAQSGRTDNANFNYFPSMDGIAIWQFTDNWRGLSVDGNITLLPLAMNSAASSSAQTSSTTTTTQQTPTQNISQAASSATNVQKTESSEVKSYKTIMHKALIYDKNGHSTGNAIGAYAPITVYGGLVKIGSKNYYKIGDNQYVVVGNVDGTSRTLKHNAYVYNNKGRRVWSSGKLYRGTPLKTYGSRMRINNKSYYRINRNRYVKVGNF